MSMQYVIMQWNSMDLKWEVFGWAHNRKSAEFSKAAAINRYGKNNVRLMIEENHAFADYMERTKNVKPAAPTKKLAKTTQSSGGGF